MMASTKIARTLAEGRAAAPLSAAQGDDERFPLDDYDRSRISSGQAARSNRKFRSNNHTRPSELWRDSIAIGSRRMPAAIARNRKTTHGCGSCRRKGAGFWTYCAAYVANCGIREAAGT